MNEAGEIYESLNVPEIDKARLAGYLYAKDEAVQKVALASLEIDLREAHPELSSRAIRRLVEGRRKSAPR